MLMKQGIRTIVENANGDAENYTVLRCHGAAQFRINGVVRVKLYLEGDKYRG